MSKINRRKISKGFYKRVYQNDNGDVFMFRDNFSTKGLYLRLWQKIVKDELKNSFSGLLKWTTGFALLTYLAVELSSSKWLTYSFIGFFLALFLLNVCLAFSTYKKRLFLRLLMTLCVEEIRVDNYRTTIHEVMNEVNMEDQQSVVKSYEKLRDYSYFCNSDYLSSCRLDLILEIPFNQNDDLETDSLIYQYELIGGENLKIANYIIQLSSIDSDYITELAVNYFVNNFSYLKEQTGISMQDISSVLFCGLKYPSFYNNKKYIKCLRSVISYFSTDQRNVFENLLGNQSKDFLVDELLKDKEIGIIHEEMR